MERNSASFRIWVVLTVGFGLLVALIAFSGFSALQRANEIHTGISALHEADHRTEEALGTLRSDLQISAIAVRDFLLDPAADATATRTELRNLQNSSAVELNRLEPLVPGDAARFTRMRAEIADYWRSLDPVFAWTPAQRVANSAAFLRNQVLPKRQAALDLAAEIESVSEGAIGRRRDEIERRQTDLPVYVIRIIGATLVVGILIAFVSVLRIFRLERLAAIQHAKVVHAQKELRSLSQQLVHAQEEERRSLSRELHDQVGQLLTAVRIGIGNIEESVGVACPERAHIHIEQTRRIAEQALRSVRDMAMGLRPAMLDDLGLGAALEWQARQHARLCGVPVSVNLDGSLEELSDDQRTCIYRIVQEALNNIAKHAGATDIVVEVANRAGLISIMIRDNGRGFDAQLPAKGLGIVGIKERVRQLGGHVSVDSAVGQGTTLSAVIPLAHELTYEHSNSAR